MLRFVFSLFIRLRHQIFHVFLCEAPKVSTAHFLANLSLTAAFSPRELMQFAHYVFVALDMRFNRFLFFATFLASLFI
jgi:hypothetical protein